ncbi:MULTISPECIES: hypothetical protein [Pseudomonas syringae group]|uniref:Uncharacterized protein n=1 Tax=Pseudomonas syringae group genomosp. 3 TaxID=251701 RepID=A0A2K4WI47_9PSED|nr:MULTISPECIES: hypothetical protein [Pseudomonas syringae group]SOS35565.1 hypothetical protein CFBP6411_04208 [Pseudomonas syringae group genomosp. 3]SPF19799.1 hypothetical protein PSCFBP3800_04343 [Pseudomonas syringae group genomosp. 3]
MTEETGHGEKPRWFKLASSRRCILKLVDRADHSSRHGVYHPKGKGGRDIWGGGKKGAKESLTVKLENH